MNLTNSLLSFRGKWIIHGTDAGACYRRHWIIVRQCVRNVDDCTCEWTPQSMFKAIHMNFKFPPHLLCSSIPRTVIVRKLWASCWVQLHWECSSDIQLVVFYTISLASHRHSSSSHFSCSLISSFKSHFSTFPSQRWMSTTIDFQFTLLLCFSSLIDFALFKIHTQIEEKEATDDEEKQSSQGKYPQWLNLLSNRLILMSIIAIWFSTSAMAVLEPLLPIWLIAHLQPKKWQLGTVFIPDSLGYFIGTNFFGAIAFRVGQVKMSVIAIMVVGLSCFVIPEAQSVSSLIIPHFCLGLGIGVLDTSLVPYLARLADDTASLAAGGSESDEMSSSTYGSVYAIQQTAVSLAYSVGKGLRKIS